MAYWDETGYGKIGNDMRIPILELKRKIEHFQKVLNEKKNKFGKKLKRRRKKTL